MNPIPILFFILLVIITLQANQSHAGSVTNDNDLINKACDHALYKEFCKASLLSAPGSKQANLSGLDIIELKLALSNASNINQFINGLLKNTSNDPFVRQCLEDCSENYQDAIDQLNNSLAALGSERYNDVNTWVSAAMTDADSCEDGFKEKPGHVSPLTSRNTMFSHLCSNVLAITNVLAGIEPHDAIPPLMRKWTPDEYRDIGIKT
ncbi:hypothetical protein F0562_029290 [Nyssa sinensis]|uniref:Pectinesterase inhibitor domain-containing protein n=1 Tax=Nyssa sinensis TaxID=561372 RepID=A0A5J5B4L5_9ASTE|nr:hypothetical protein F0562_029290 [Nyssa sinensis]